jgi:predicted DNA-binding transcriptional regulator YafY
MRRADRLFQIVQHLRARRLTTAAQLGDLLNVSPRTIYRDVRDLSLSGIPINGEAGVGYALDRSYELTALMFTPDEVEAVVVGLRMAQAFAGHRLSHASVTALDKVVLALPKSRRGEVDRSPIYAPAIHTNQHLDPLREQLGAAVNARSVLELTYADDGSRETVRMVQPLALHFWGSVWTLAAWCCLRHGFRNFRLDRIHACTPTGESFVDEPGKTLEDFLRDIEQRFPSGKSATRKQLKA